MPLPGGEGGDTPGTAVIGGGGIFFCMLLMAASGDGWRFGNPTFAMAFGLVMGLIFLNLGAQYFSGLRYCIIAITGILALFSLGAALQPLFGHSLEDGRKAFKLLTTFGYCLAVAVNQYRLLRTPKED
ncbi:hypothetical protein PVT67_17180 [Gallaecimonas kandeliae]|uniref:hypothetical protein n=1 Tax=Gallaecimonas kandeliae TaxID=3029055 RepID=UPI002647BD39|nr:hypothetical protein [Gallaecimonas kandeliae]WKE65375.1 hypothetical protein PVT67_17180 [Gallaecimonas kandeliae]